MLCRHLRLMLRINVCAMPAAACPQVSRNPPFQSMVRTTIGGNTEMGWRTILAAAVAATAISFASQAAPKGASPGDIRIDGVHVFPESMSSTADGTIYVGSIWGVVYRARPGQAIAEA